MLKLVVNIKLKDKEPLETLEEEIKAIKHIILTEFGNYNFIVSEVTVEEDHS